MIFAENQIIEGIYPPEAAEWCNSNGCYIEEIDSIETEEERELEVFSEDEEGIPVRTTETVIETVTKRRFQIKKIPPPPQEEVERMQREARMEELQDYLKDTDWYAIREAETGKPIPEEIRAGRESARAEISELRDGI